MSTPASLPHSEDQPKVGRLFLAALIFSYFATTPLFVLTGLLLVDISQTFTRSVATMGQIQTLASLFATITALLMGVLSTRFKHKSLLMGGLLFVSLSALGASIALNFTMILIAYALYGIGLSMADPMTLTLVGRFPLKQRATAMGRVVSGGAIALLLGAPISGVLTEMGSWRYAYIGFAMPSALLSLILVMKGVSAANQSESPPKEKEQYIEGLKEIAQQRSALVCLVSTALLYAAWQGITLYGVSFLREHFDISLGRASLILVGVSICFIGGSQLSGMVVNQFGRKSATIATAFITGTSTIVFFRLQSSESALLLLFVVGAFTGMRLSASSSLSLEQVPRYRGSMMSLNSAATWLGSALGASIGGLSLYWLRYEGVGFSLGVMSLIAIVLVYFLVIDPTQTVIHSMENKINNSER